MEEEISSFVVNSWRQEYPVLPSEGKPEEQKQHFTTKEAGWAVYLELRAIVTNFYNNLFAFESTDNMEEVLSTVLVKVTPEMNRTLLDSYKEGEVKDALFQMFLTKAPGPDGFPAHFFQRHWELCGKEVTTIVLKLLNGKEEPTGVNETLIVLIPKVASPEEIGQF